MRNESLNSLAYLSNSAFMVVADYERFGEAVARALGFEPGDFQRQYAELVRAGIDRALEK